MSMHGKISHGMYLGKYLTCSMREMHLVIELIFYLLIYKFMH